MRKIAAARNQEGRCSKLTANPHDPWRYRLAPASSPPGCLFDPLTGLQSLLQMRIMSGIVVPVSGRLLKRQFGPLIMEKTQRHA